MNPKKPKKSTALDRVHAAIAADPGMTNHEIAEVLGCPVGTVNWALSTLLNSGELERDLGEDYHSAAHWYLKNVSEEEDALPIVRRHAEAGTWSVGPVAIPSSIFRMAAL